MQDRFKCRVWDKDAKEYLTLYKEDEKTGMHIDWISWDNTGVYHYERDVERDVVFVTDISQFVEIEQSTGLKDKNGRLIYEGDIIRVEDNNCLIARDNDNARYNVGGYGEIAYLNYNEIEVIGNIHENPELAEV